VKILVDRNLKAKVEFRRLVDQVIHNIIDCPAFVWVFLTDQLGPISYVIHLILNPEFFLQGETVGMQLSQPLPGKLHGADHIRAIQWVLGNDFAQQFSFRRNENEHR